MLTRATLIRHLELQTAPTNLDNDAVNDFFNKYRTNSIDFPKFLNLAYFYDFFYSFAGSNYRLERNEFTKVVGDYYFPKLLHKAIQDFRNDIPIKFIEEAYKQKFKLSNPLHDLNIKSRFPETNKTIDENAMFSKELNQEDINFLQTKNKMSNTETVFSILDADRDGVLTFAEF